MANPQNLRPFQKGNQAGVGHGRPKGSKSLTQLLQKALDIPLTLKNSQTGQHEEKLTSEWLIAVMVREALKGNKYHIQEIWDRTEGKPLQTVESQQTIDLDMSALTDAQLAMIIERGKIDE